MGNDADDVAYVIQKTRFKSDMIRLFYEEGFLPIANRGRISKRMFQKLFMMSSSMFLTSLMSPNGDVVDGSLYCFLQEVFDTMDTEKTGRITFRQLMTNLDELCNGDIDHILRKVFSIFDHGSRGRIMQQEIKSLFHCLQFVAIDDHGESLQRMGEIAQEVCRGHAGQGRVLFQRPYFTADDFVAEFSRHTEERDLVLNAIRTCFRL